ncbi:MAG: glycosyl transferase family 25 [Arenicella sp.]|jgi:glycosyl transferase family 25
MKIFVISLKNSTRRESIISVLNQHKLDFEIFDAINGKELSEDFIQSHCDVNQMKEQSHWFTKGMAGCALSHYYLYKKIVENNIEKAIIIEDDMNFDSNFGEIVKKLETRVVENEVLMIYYRGWGNIKFTTHKAENITSTHRVLNLYSWDDVPNTTGAYYITNKSAKILSEFLLPIRVGPDDWTYFMQNSQLATIKVIYPRIAFDNNFKSEIDYVESQNKWLGRISETINRYKIPLLYSFLKYRRRERETEMSKFSLVEKPTLIK